MPAQHGTAWLWRTWVSPEPEASKSTLDARLDPEGRLTALEYTWEVDGTAQRGQLSVQRRGEGAEVSVHWKDTWHAGDGMTLSGTQDEVLNVLGSYAAPPGPDWGWRIVVRRSPHWEMVMDNISPEGQADRAFLVTDR